MSQLRELKVEGKTIDEAIYRGLQQLEVSIDEVKIETLQSGSKGFMGIGAKPCIVKLTVRPDDYMFEKEPEPAPAPAPVKAQPKQESSYIKETSKPQAPTIVQTKQTTDEEPKDLKKRPRTDRRQSEGQPAQLITEYVYTPYQVGDEQAPGGEFLTELLVRMGIEANISYVLVHGGIRFKIDSKTMGILIGYRGETLDAMQYLTSLVVNKGREEYIRVTLDTEGYRNKREETLHRLARKIASQVKSTGQIITLEPMNPYERRILHSTLQNNRYVTTYSVGDEPNRKVVVAPKGTH